MINIGIVGCGYWGPNLIRNFKEVADADVVMCADSREDRLQYIKKRYKSLEVTRDYRDILKNDKIDAVAVAVPVGKHFQIARDSLLAGKHVIVEKPLARTSEEAKQLIALSEDKDRLLMVGHTFEYSGAVNKIKEIIEQGVLGDIYYFNSSRVNLGLFQPDINVVWDLAPHDLSILHYCLGEMPKYVSATAEGHIHTDREDIAFINLRFSGKLIGHIHVSWLEPVKYRRTVIGGSKKMIVYDDAEPIEKVKIYDKGVDIFTDPVSLLDKQLIYRTGDMVAPTFDTGESLKFECAHFVDCIISNKKPRSGGNSGLRVIRVLEAIERSIARNGEVVPVE